MTIFLVNWTLGRDLELSFVWLGFFVRSLGEQHSLDSTHEVVYKLQSVDRILTIVVLQQGFLVVEVQI